MGSNYEYTRLVQGFYAVVAFEELRNDGGPCFGRRCVELPKNSGAPFRVFGFVQASVSAFGYEFVILRFNVVWNMLVLKMQA